MDPVPDQARLDATADAVLAQEAARKSAVLWLALPGAVQPVAAWHTWVDGAVVVVHEGGEQSLPGLQDAGEVEVLLRSKDNGSLLLRIPARVIQLTPQDPRWAPAVAALHSARQSAPDGEAQPQRWATSSRVTRLELHGPATQAPGFYPVGDRRAAPVDTPATTLGALPFLIGRRPRRRPSL